MTTLNKKFDPFVQGEQNAAEGEILLSELEAFLRRVRLSQKKMRDENERLQAERNRLRFYSEAEAADLLRLTESRTPERAREALGEMRNRYKLPHRRLGKDVVYTADDIAAAMQIFEIKGVGRRAVRGKVAELQSL